MLAYFFAADAGTPAGTFIGTVSAVDPGVGQVTYRLQGNAPFTINSATGQITTTKDLVYLDDISWSLTALASDPQGETTSVPVVISLASSGPRVGTQDSPPEYTGTGEFWPVPDPLEEKPTGTKRGEKETEDQDPDSPPLGFG
ncbi:cadherin repeat domain-containing protein [Calycomorphotria hydatis]|uniref:Cadherin domain protein n=1 Tax=Calycomorphotria hydatis TaxID=2528027 RepID=A0A517T4Y6_9PLAN|nr:cadherin repeat domain-containing protein [Calycomorphotria hydatis]QDT63429.1 Cadherin domain protein [Calycomorphotria hydatis]